MSANRISTGITPRFGELCVSLESRKSVAHADQDGR